MHESIMTGHLSIRSSVHKVLSEHLMVWKALLPGLRYLQKFFTGRYKRDRSSLVIRSALEDGKYDEQQNQVSIMSQFSETGNIYNTDDVRESSFDVQCNVYGSRCLSDISE